MVAKSTFMATSALLMFGAAIPAMAQTRQSEGWVVSQLSLKEDSSQAIDGLEEIVVTAQKRAENVQRIPISITTVTSQTLAQKGITNVLDLTVIVPGLQYNTTSGGASPVIRGIGTSIALGGNENSVATYVDGVYYASNAGSIMSFNNVDQIAVLKGPQGTLFGRNATGGVIQITTLDPEYEFSGLAKATYGNHNTYGADLYVTGGLSDAVAADISIQYNNLSDGFGQNTITGSRVGQSRDFAIRSKWLFTLGPKTKATLIADYSSTVSGDPSFRPPYDSLPLSGVPYTGKPFDVNNNTDARNDIAQGGISLKVDHELSFAKLVSISAYRRTSWKSTWDSDATPIDYSTINLNQADMQISQELQLVSTADGPLKWAAGLYYFHSTSNFGPTTVSVITPAGPGSGIVSIDETRQSTISFAGFGQVTYDFGQGTSLTLGLRYTNEKKSMFARGRFLIPAFGVVNQGGPYTDAVTIGKPTWRVALNHQFTADVMGYVSYNRGFKSGGYDPTSIFAPSYFRPEVLDAFETGFKSELFDRRLRLNAAAYYYDFKDIQLNTFIGGLPAVYNGTSATIKGLELDFVALPVDNLTLTGGIAYVHGRYGDFPVTRTALTPGGGIDLLPDISASGKRLASTPDWQINVGAEYKIQLEAGTITTQINYFHSSKWFANPENRLFQAPYSLVNASSTWVIDANGRYSAQVWGRNLGNVAYASQLVTQTPTGDFLNIARGRTFGLTLGARF